MDIPGWVPPESIIVPVALRGQDAQTRVGQAEPLLPGLGAMARNLAGSVVADRPSGSAILANARDCPHRQPIPKGERVGCGCSHRCTAGRSTRANGGIQVDECWECPLAPRRSGG